MKQSFKTLLLTSTFLVGAVTAAFASSENLLDLKPVKLDTTRAVVVGISQYENEGNEDLRFAHRDAEVFYDYLRSKAGGKLPERNIKLLTNDNATVASISLAINWLKEKTSKGDTAIFYFSGHGKVESNPIAEHGFLLAANSPPNNLKNNSIRIEDLDEDAKLLSAVKEAKVIFILDACRSGTIANVGPVLNTEFRGKQKENEVRLLSCKADQKSLENELWGQGRGLFSYYLVNGLMGLADTQNDGVVTLEELKDYMSSNIKKALVEGNFDQRQTPVFVGEDETFELARVDEPALVAWQEKIKQEQEGGIAMAMATAPVSGIRGDAAEDDGQLKKDRDITDFLKAINLDVLANSEAFNQALNSKEGFLNYILSHGNSSFTVDSPELKAGEEAFQALAQRAGKDMAARTYLSNKIAIELHNRVQAVINLYLAGDFEEIANRQFKDRTGEYAKYPKLIKAIMQLIEPDQTLFRQLEVNYLYFTGVIARISQKADSLSIDPTEDPLTIQKQALALDDKAAYIHNELGIIYLQSDDLANAEKHFKQAAELAPGWALPPSNLSIVYSQQKKLGEASANARRAMELQPDYYASYTTLGSLALEEKNYLKSEAMFTKAMKLNPAHFFAFEQFAQVCLATTRYREADQHFETAENLKNDFPTFKINNNTTLANSHSVNDFEIIRPRQPLIFNPKTAADFMHNGEVFFSLGNYEEAAESFRDAAKLAPAHPTAYEFLCKSLYHLGRYEEALLSYEKLVKIRPDELGLQLLLADVYQKQGRWLEKEAIYKGLYKNEKASSQLKKEAYKRLIKLTENQQRYWEQEQLMVEYDVIFGEDDNVDRQAFYYKMVQRYPDNLDWMSKQANYYHEKGYANWASEEYEKILERDSLRDGAGFMHAKIGATADNDNTTIAHFLTAMRLMPGLSSPKFNLIEIYHRQLEFDKEISVLEDLLGNNQINMELRLKLADLYMLSSRYSESDTLLTTASNIKLEEVDGLDELQGKLDLLRGENLSAIEYYKKVLASKPTYDQAEVQYTIARLYAWAGDKDQAWKWLQKAIANGFKYKWVIKYDEVWKDYPQRLDANEPSRPSGGQ